MTIGDSEASVEMPGFGDAFELVDAAVAEGDVRPGDEVLHRRRHERFTRFGERLYPLSDMDGDATDVGTAQFDFDVSNDPGERLPDRNATGLGEVLRIQLTRRQSDPSK